MNCTLILLPIRFCRREGVANRDGGIQSPLIVGHEGATVAALCPAIKAPYISWKNRTTNTPIVQPRRAASRGLTGTVWPPARRASSACGDTDSCRANQKAYTTRQRARIK